MTGVGRNGRETPNLTRKPRPTNVRARSIPISRNFDSGGCPPSGLGRLWRESPGGGGGGASRRRTYIHQNESRAHTRVRILECWRHDDDSIRYSNEEFDFELPSLFVHRTHCSKRQTEREKIRFFLKEHGRHVDVSPPTSELRAS